MSVLDFLFPRRCLGCGRWGAYFCSQCLNALPLEPQRICPICGKPAMSGVTHPGCRRQAGLDGLTFIFAYRGLVKKAIRKLKYRFVTDLADDLVEFFLSFGGEDRAFAAFCRQKGVGLVPVPLHPRRERWRGFNQAQLLGQMIADNLDIKFLPGLLKRVRYTQPQIKLNAEQRRDNIRNAFKVEPQYFQLPLPASRFLLFDDVWTTGATLKEAGKALKKAGARRVWGLTLAA